MPIYQRESGIWYIDIVTQSGKRIRRSAKTKDKTAAQALHDKISYEQWRVDKMEVKPKVLWDQAALRWIRERSNKKSINDDKRKIRLLSPFRGRLLNQMTRDFIMHVITHLTCSNATKNRYIALIRAILRKCEREWEWIDKSPTLSTFREPRRRIRWLKKDEAEQLLSCLPDLLSDMAKFSLMTGLRQRNVLNLEWSQVDIQSKMAWIYADQTKSGRNLGVPLNNGAIQVLKKRIGMNRRYVFAKEGKPLKGISSKVWKKALQEAGITDFRWHDLRHTWASWLVQSGVPLMDLQEMGGWESISMVQKYAHLAPIHLRKNAILLDKVYDTN